MNIKRLLNILNPKPSIGGLEISDSNLKFAVVKDNKLFFTSLNLAAGIVKEGKINDRENFKAALAKLHSQITPRIKKKIYVILNVPDVNIYTKVFDLPVIAVDNLEEAAYLNLRMISPTDFSTVYSDWQKVGETAVEGGQIEILGAFVSNKIIDEFVQCLKETNFFVAAVEFPSLSVSRLISALKESVNSFLLLHLTASGLNFGFIRHRNLYFNHFVSWSSGEERQISLSDIKEIIIRETQKVLNFANSHWPETQITNLLLAAPALEEKMSQIIAENFSFTVQKMILPENLPAPDGEWSIFDSRLPSLTSEWFSVLGSAARGLISRSKDTIISLASTGTEEEFRQDQLVNFIKTWTRIVFTTFSFILVAFIAADVFLMTTANSLNNRLANLGILPEMGEINKLQDEAANFNQRVDLALQARSQVFNWSPFFDKIKILTGEEITVERIFIQSSDSPILFNGLAADEKAIIDFKDRMNADSQIKDINLPLTGIGQTAGGRLGFTMTFKFIK